MRVLEIRVPIIKYWAVSESDDFRARAESIFERLRSGGNGNGDGEPAAPGSAGNDPSADPASPDAEAGVEPAYEAPVGPEGAEPAGDSSADLATPWGNDPGAGMAPSHAQHHEDLSPETGAGHGSGDEMSTPGGIGVAESAVAAHHGGTGDEPAEPEPPGSEPSLGPDRSADAEHPGPRQHELPRRLAIANQKGGVGKTTTAVNLGAALAELGYRVLVVDLDPQGNATTGLGINGRNLDSSIYDVILHDVPIEDVIEPTSLRNLFVVPATIDLAGAEIELVPVFSRELRLRKALENVSQDFDFVLVDCPPSLGLLTVNGLAAAGEVVVPIQCEYYALEGLGQLLRNVALVQANLNPELEVSTIVLTMYDARTRLAEQVVDEVRQHFGDKVCRNVVPRTVRLSEAPSFGQPIIVFDSSSRGSIAYRELAKEVSGGAPQRVR